MTQCLFRSELKPKVKNLSEISLNPIEKAMAKPQGIFENLNFFEEWLVEDR